MSVRRKIPEYNARFYELGEDALGLTTHVDEL